MCFNAFAYLTNSETPKNLAKYFSFFRKGILIDTETLYLLIVGRYDLEHKKYFLEKLNFTLDDYKILRHFLNSVKNCPFFITPHIFTKFIHLLWTHIKDAGHFNKIIEIFLSNFNYIGEKTVHKNKIMNLTHFKNKKWDLNNTSLILTAQEHNHNSIITCNQKFVGICKNKKDLLVIYYGDLKKAVQTIPYNL